MLRKLHPPRPKLAASGLVLGAAFFVWGCKKNPAAPADAGALATISDAQAGDAAPGDGGGAANDAGTALVLYEDDEVAVDHVPLTVKVQSASVRAAPSRRGAARRAGADRRRARNSVTNCLSARA